MGATGGRSMRRWRGAMRCGAVQPTASTGASGAGRRCSMTASSFTSSSTCSRRGTYVRQAPLGRAGPADPQALCAQTNKRAPSTDYAKWTAKGTKPRLPACRRAPQGTGQYHSAQAYRRCRPTVLPPGTVCGALLTARNSCGHSLARSQAVRAVQCRRQVHPHRRQRGLA
jgi:hypothetical protein